MRHPRHNDLLRLYFDGHGEPCPQCGYDLRDLKSDRCPECGRPVELCVRAGDATTPFLTGLMGFVGPACTALMGLAGSLVLGLKQTFSWASLAGGFWVDGTVLAASAIGMGLWTLSLPRLRAQSYGRRWLLAGVPWLLAAAGLGTCLLLFF